MNSQTINRKASLPDTTLAAIVRDEEYNPAGGIEEWLRCTLPYVVAAEVIDTGSRDNTWRILQETQNRFPHLQIRQEPFSGFDIARNASMRDVRTTYTLVLDADELLLPEDFSNIHRFMQIYGADAYDFSILTWYPDGTNLEGHYNALNPRLFRKEEIEIRADGWSESETIIVKGDTLHIPPELARIKHFKAKQVVDEKKRENWYEKKAYKHESPLENARKNGWKEFNPARLQYPYTKLAIPGNEPLYSRAALALEEAVEIHPKKDEIQTGNYRTYVTST